MIGMAAAGAPLGRASGLALALLAVAALQAGCGEETRGVPARGAVAGRRIETTVDSAEARYLLSRGLTGAPSDPALDARIELAGRQLRGAEDPREHLARIAREFSTDFATLLLAEELLAVPPNARMQALYLEELGRLEAGRAAPLPPRETRYAVLFVPGWLYRSHPENGAGFQRQLALAAQMGLEAELVPTAENASVEHNAGLIADDLRRRRDDGRRYILATASKSGAEVALALAGLSARETGHVAAWVNIGGVLGGSPLADAALTAPRCWGALAFLGWRPGGLDGMRSMSTAARRSRVGELRLPGHILVVNYLPLPLSGNVTPRARSGYESMRALGPNDGLALTPDEIFPGAVSILEVGLDHFMTVPDIDRRTAALIRSVIDTLSRSPAAAGDPESGRAPAPVAARREPP
jgi:hypothetical protein